MSKKVFWMVAMISTLSTARSQTLSEQDLRGIVEHISEANHPDIAPPLIEYVADTESMELRFVASPDPTIRIGQGILSYCDSFGDYATDALAFVMGHELSHYYDNDEILSQSLERAALEQRADLNALFMTFKADYRAMAVAADVLTGQYEQMQLKVDLDYPGLADRVKSISTTVQLFEQNVFVYQAATFLYYHKQYEQASALFEQLSRKIHVPEVRNSLAASQLNLAIANLPPEIPFYAFPLEVDPGIRLEGRLQRASNAAEVVFDRALNKSIDWLERLVRYNPDDQPAMINLTVAYYLAGKLSEAEALLDQYKKGRNRPANYATMKALLAEASGKSGQANAWFKKAMKAGDFNADYNYELFKTSAELRRKKRSSLIRAHLMGKPAQAFPMDWKKPEPARFERLTTLTNQEIIRVSYGIDKELVLEIDLEDGFRYSLFPGFLCTQCDRAAIARRRQQVLNYQETLQPEDYQVLRYSGISIWLLKSDNLMLFMRDGELNGWFRYEVN